MSYYRGTADGPDKAKAIAAVALVHVGLGAAILTGLNTETVTRTVESMTVFDVAPERPPPPPPPPPPEPKPSAPARLEEGAAGKKAEPSPIVLPKPRVQLPAKPPIAAAPVAGRGSASNAGAANAGTGPGAGGEGSGRGGGTGAGGTDYSRYTPARPLNNLSRRDYQSITQGRLPSGRAMTALRITTDGTVSSCVVVRSSGDALVDSALCALISRRLRYRPALDDQGRPIPYGFQYVASWSL